MDLTIIQNKIHEIRGQRVMLDRDLAELYQVETRALNQVVKRNIQRFPADFMFQLTEDEAKNLISHFVTSRWGGIRKLPYAFTEHGVATLSGLLNSNIAIETNIAIMRAFVAMSRYLIERTAPDNDIPLIDQEIRELKQYIEEVFAE